MILLTDEVRGWGNIATVHYVHPARAAVVQAVLAGRTDFTEIDRAHLVRAVAFFTGYVAGGVPVDLTTAPHFGASLFAATGLTEVHAQLFADNCGARAIINEFSTDATTAPVAVGGAVPSGMGFLQVAFHNPGNNTVAYRHIVRVVPGGRTVDATEAEATARANAARLLIDADALDMRITSDAAAANEAPGIDRPGGETRRDRA